MIVGQLYTMNVEMGTIMYGKHGNYHYSDELLVYIGRSLNGGCAYVYTQRYGLVNIYRPVSYFDPAVYNK